MAVAAIGLIGDVLGLVTMGMDAGAPPEGPKVAFNFYVGNDGAKDPNNTNAQGKGLDNAGGNKPEVWIWEDNGDFIKKDKPGDKCKDGVIVCGVEIDNVSVAPEYALIIGQNDAICLSYAIVDWPNQEARFGSLLGAWAKTCSQKYKGRGGAWYWSDMSVKNKATDEWMKTECAWIDADGDQPTTGISIHWRDFDGKQTPNGDGKDLDYFCKNDRVIKYHTEKKPNSAVFSRAERDMFSRDPDDEHTIAAREQDKIEAHARRTTEKFSRSLVKSRAAEHSAQQLCQSSTSAGPDFGSEVEGMFCYMKTKTVYPYCTPGHTEACFDNQAHKLVGVPGAGKREPLPELEFDKVTEWA
ncbi:hypothetical protein F4778DRAFT_747010 [Xylariomycetidae sp. FL2044]|nr:hypothetical protein F4778DRAFT_747010 [Xylariomycetidae sp. FL2044]